MKDRLQRDLDESIVLLESGASIEDCLARHPESAAELVPLLEAVVQLRSSRVMTPVLPSDARTRVRARVLDAWDAGRAADEARPSRPSFLHSWLFTSRRALAPAAAVLVLAVIGGTGTLAAAESSMPGQAFYPVKEFRERAQLWFAQSPEEKVIVSSRLARERAREIRRLATEQTTNDAAISQAVARLDGHLRTLHTTVQEQGGDLEPEATEALRSVYENTGTDSVPGLLAEALQAAPSQTQPEVLRAVNAIEGARQRVQEAVEALRAPPTP